MPDMPRTKFNSPWTVANIEAELEGTKNARGNLTMTEKFEQKVETSTYATDKTVLAAEIAAVANAGAKNYCPYNTLTATGSGTLVNKGAINLPKGTYNITYKVTASTGSVAVRLLKNDASLWNETISNTGGAVTTTINIADDANQITFYASVANTITDIMIADAAITDATYQPYAPTNRELYEMILALQ